MNHIQQIINVYSTEQLNMHDDCYSYVKMITNDLQNNKIDVDNFALINYDSDFEVQSSTPFTLVYDSDHTYCIQYSDGITLQSFDDKDSAITFMVSGGNSNELVHYDVSTELPYWSDQLDEINLTLSKLDRYDRSPLRM